MEAPHSRAEESLSATSEPPPTKPAGFGSSASDPAAVDSSAGTGVGSSGATSGGSAGGTGAGSSVATSGAFVGGTGAGSSAPASGGTSAGSSVAASGGSTGGTGAASGGSAGGTGAGSSVATSGGSAGGTGAASGGSAEGTGAGPGGSAGGAATTVIRAPAVVRAVSNVPTNLTASALLPPSGALRLGVVSSLGRGVLPDDLAADSPSRATIMVNTSAVSTPGVVSGEDVESSPGDVTPRAGRVSEIAGLSSVKDKRVPPVTPESAVSQTSAVNVQRKSVSVSSSASVDQQSAGVSPEGPSSTLCTPVRSDNPSVSPTGGDRVSQSANVTGRAIPPIIQGRATAEAAISQSSGAVNQSPKPQTVSINPVAKPQIVSANPVAKPQTVSVNLPRKLQTVSANPLPKPETVFSDPLSKPQTVPTSASKDVKVESSPGSDSTEKAAASQPIPPAICGNVLEVARASGASAPSESQTVKAKNLSAETVPTGAKAKPLPALTPISSGFGAESLAAASASTVGPPTETSGRSLLSPSVVSAGVVMVESSREKEGVSVVETCADGSVLEVTTGPERQVTTGSSGSSQHAHTDEEARPVKTANTAAKSSPARAARSRRGPGVLPSTGTEESAAASDGAVIPAKRGRGAPGSAESGLQTADAQRAPPGDRGPTKRKATTRQNTASYEESDDEYEFDNSADVKSPPAKRSRAVNRRQQPASTAQSKRKRKSLPSSAGPSKKLTREEVDAGEIRTPERQSRRARVPVQPFQSPLSQFESIPRQLRRASQTAAIGTQAGAERSPKQLILFFKNEFLAIRSESGGYYVCQCVQNVTRKSGSVKIRWMTDHKNNIYTPDFYDSIDFDCILTSLDVKSVGRGRFQLAEEEAARAEGILARAVARDRGQLAGNELHPQQQGGTLGLDISLYTDESQLVTESPRRATGNTSVSSQHHPATGVSNQRQPATGVSNQHQPTSGVSNQHQPASATPTRSCRSTAAAQSPTNGHSQPADIESRDPQVRSPVGSGEKQSPRKQTTAAAAAGSSHTSPARTPDAVTPGSRRTRRRLLP